MVKQNGINATILLLFRTTHQCYIEKMVNVKGKPPNTNLNRQENYFTDKNRFYNSNIFINK